MRERDSLKKRFDKNPNDFVWSQFKKARNEVNDLVKKTKRDYFMTQINTGKRDPKNTWRLINELTSRKTSVNSNSSWEICHRCAKILLAVEHKMQLA